MEFNSKQDLLSSNLLAGGPFSKWQCSRVVLRGREGLISPLWRDICAGVRLDGDVPSPLLFKAIQDHCVHEVRKPRVVVLKDDGSSQLLGMLTEQEPCGHWHPSHWKRAGASKRPTLWKNQHVFLEGIQSKTQEDAFVIPPEAQWAQRLAPVSPRKVPHCLSLGAYYLPLAPCLHTCTQPG